MRAFLVSLSLVAVVLAGCSEGGGPSDPCELDPAACGPTIDPNDVDKGKGVIRGVVIDPSITPIEGATVVLTGSQDEAVTDANGAFVFLNLEPATYFLTASKPGYSTVQQSVGVEAGVAQPPVTKIMLEQLPGTEPFSSFLQYSGYIGCAFKAANYVFPNQCEPIGDPDTYDILDFGTQIVPQMVQTEIIWEQTQEIGRDLGTIQYVEDAEGGRQRVGNVWGPSPLICTVTLADDCDNGDGTGGGGDGLNETGFPGKYFASVYAACYQQCVIGAVGAGAILQQDYTLLAGAFFNHLPPEGWTLINDGEHHPE